MAIETAPQRVRLAVPDLPDVESAHDRKRRRDKHAFWRLCGWGGSAAIALAALAITTQSDIGNQRLQLALATESQAERPTVVVEAAPRPPEPDTKTLALEAQLRTLAADRDRLAARIAGLEQNLEDMTGSIKRQAASIAESPPPAPPVVQQVATASPVLVPLALPENAAPWPVIALPPAESATLVDVPMPPVRVAAAPAVEPAAPRKQEAGVDLGGAPNLDVLNARWVAVKANFGPLLGGLHALAAHDRRPGSTDLRLLAGPLPSFAAASQLCVRFAAARVTCRPAKFDGEQIAAR
jgi:hypothetical protein